jgi:hypothetical protein
MHQLSTGNTNTVSPGQRIKVALVVSKFPACDLTARTVEVVYRVYSTDAAYFASRQLESARVLPDRSLTVGEASEKQGKILPAPFIGYNRSKRVFGGVKASWTGQGTLLNAAAIEAGGSSSSYSAGLSLGGAMDPSQGLLSHVEWKIGFKSSDDPAGILHLTKSVGTAQFFGATRAYGPLGTMFRFGASLEGGNLSAGTGLPGVLSDAPQRGLKSYVGGTWSYGRQIWNASYGFQLGKGTDQTPVDYSKHIIDVTHQVRFLPREHWPIQVDSHFNAGWILGSPAVVPVVERFFGGNLPRDFVDNPLWKIPEDPLLRSFPQNRLNLTGAGQPIGGTTFTAVNITAAFPVWSYPAMPAIVRNAKPVSDGIHLGLQPAQRTSLQDFRARTSQFPEVLKRAIAVAPDLDALRARLSVLAGQGLSDDLTGELNDLITNSIVPARHDIDTAKSLPRNGLAWSICMRLSKDDPDSYPLAHLHEDIIQIVAPGLEALSRMKDAQDLRAMAEKLDQDKSDLAVLLARIEPQAVIPQSRLDVFQEDLQRLNQLGQRLLDETVAFGGAEAPVGTLAFDAKEWSTSLINTTSDPGPDPDPFDSLYGLTRLSLGIGKLVPPQIESAALAAEGLAEAIRQDHPAESARIIQIAQDLRTNLASLATRLKAISIPAGERWARQQNDFFVRALDVTFREMNLAAISPVAMFDAARIGPQLAGVPSVRYGAGPGIRFSIVSFQVTLGYSLNPNPRPAEKRGAFFFSMEVVDLFR